MTFNEEAKSHKNPLEKDRPNQRGAMFEEPGNPLCPVASLQKYLRKIPPGAKALYLQPKREVGAMDIFWYNNVPLGVNKLSQMLPKMCKLAGTRRFYTNHSMRPTSIQKLFDAGLKEREIMAVTGHRSESSIKAYWRPASDNRIRWSSVLSDEDLCQHHDCEEEESVSEQQFCNQGKNSILDQQDPLPVQIKDEQEEVSTCHGGEQPVLKQEDDTGAVVTLTLEGTEHGEPEKNDLPQKSVCVEKSTFCDLKDPEPLKVKDEQADLVPQGGQLVLKQEADTLTGPSTSNGSDHNKPVGPSGNSNIVLYITWKPALQLHGAGQLPQSGVGQKGKCDGALQSANVGSVFTKDRNVQTEREAEADRAQRGQDETEERSQGEESVQAEGPGEVRAEEGEKDDTTKKSKHRTSGWDPNWSNIPTFEPWLYNTSNGKFHYALLLCKIKKINK
ncbi:uncharacterized protein KZ484_018229 isoform 2-T2 [Pholidichthys leucotaenia]